jgi:hypothetical protein
MSEKQALVDLVTMTSACRRFLFLGPGTVLEPVISDGPTQQRNHSERRLEVFGDFIAGSIQTAKSNHCGRKRSNPESKPQSFVRFAPQNECVPQGALRDAL